MPIPVNAEKFGALWNSWWKVIQPIWRGKSLSRVVPLDANWSPLLCGGANGLLLVILALAWWMKATNDSTSTAIMAAIDEVNWALIQLTTALQSNKANGKKRQPESSAIQEQAPKRYIYLYWNIS